MPSSSRFCYFSLDSTHNTSRRMNHHSNSLPQTPTEDESTGFFTMSASATPSDYRMDASRHLQLPTQNSLTTRDRPQPQPLQNVLHIEDLSSDDESISSTCSAPTQSMTARCSRCHRTLSTDASAGITPGNVSYGLNLWYCSRCAAFVGYNR